LAHIRGDSAAPSAYSVFAIDGGVAAAADFATPPSAPMLTPAIAMATTVPMTNCLMMPGVSPPPLECAGIRPGIASLLCRDRHHGNSESSGTYRGAARNVVGICVARSPATWSYL